MDLLFSGVQLCQSASQPGKPRLQRCCSSADTQSSSAFPWLLFAHGCKCETSLTAGFSVPSAMLSDQSLTSSSNHQMLISLLAVVCAIVLRSKIESKEQGVCTR